MQITLLRSVTKQNIDLLSLLFPLGSVGAEAPSNNAAG